MAEEVSDTVNRLCNKVYLAQKEKDWVSVLKLNIRLVLYRCEPEHRARADRTIANLRDQLEELL